MEKKQDKSKIISPAKQKNFAIEKALQSEKNKQKEKKKKKRNGNYPFRFKTRTTKFWRGSRNKSNRNKTQKW